MIVLAFDPGVTTGVAVIDTASKHPLNLYEETEPEGLAECIDAYRRDNPTVVVEGFPGGGFKTREGVQTIKVFGFVEYFSRSLGLEVVVRQPQHRKPYVEEARRLAGSGRRHAVDALAHALSYAASIG